MRLKLPANSFLVVGERERGNGCVNSKYTFAGVCDEALKNARWLWDASVSFISMASWILEDLFSSRLSLICPHSDSSFLSIHFSSNVANDIVFLIFKLNWKIPTVCLFAVDVTLSLIFWGKVIVTWIAVISYS